MTRAPGRNGPLFASLLGAALLAACGSSSSGGGGSPSSPGSTTSAASGRSLPDPCTVLTADEIHTATQRDLAGDPKESQNSTYGEHICTWSLVRRTDAHDANRVYVRVVLSKGTDSISLDSYFRTVAMGPPIPGIGEKAARGDDETIVVQHGMVMTVHVAVDATLGENDAAADSLARLAVARL